jgi:HD-like signal output (HDOD) protein
VTGAFIIIVLGSTSLAIGVTLMFGSVYASTRVVQAGAMAFVPATPEPRIQPSVRKWTPEPVPDRPSALPEPPPPIRPPLELRWSPTPSAASLAVTTSPAPLSRRVSLEIVQEQYSPPAPPPQVPQGNQRPSEDEVEPEVMTSTTSRNKVILLVGIRSVPLPGPSWRQHSVSNVDEALQLLEKLPCDVILVDYHHNPTEVLSRITQDHPHLSRLVRCNDDQAEDLRRLVPDAQEAVLKHMTNEEFFALLERTTAMAMGELGQRVIKALGPVSALPALPANYQQIQRIINDPNGSVRRVAGVISQDIGLTTKVLQVVNSPVYGSRSPITDVVHAATLLGMRGIRDLALTIEVFGFFSAKLPMGGVTVEDLYNDSVQVAALAHRIGKIHAEDAYTAALLHQIGRLILMTKLPDPYQDALELHTEQGVPLRDAQRTAIGIDQDETTAYLLNLWGLPQRVIEAVAFYDAPALVPHTSVDVVDILHAAVALMSEHEGEETLVLDETHLEILGASELIEDWRKTASTLCQVEEETDFEIAELDVRPPRQRPSSVF